MSTRILFFARVLFALACSAGSIASAASAETAAASPTAVRHSYLVMGGKTAIINEQGSLDWEYRGGTRDGFILPNGNFLAAWSDRVEEVTRDKKVVFLTCVAGEQRNRHDPAPV